MSLPQPSSAAVKSGEPSMTKRSLGEFTNDERALLLRLAHESILSALENREIALDLRGALRGCVGYVLPVSPVYRAVADTARAAALEDTRFHPVTLPEARDLEIELSLLSPPQPIAAEAVEIGRHGLLITMAGRRGLLLPQVPTEHHWDRTTFLEQTCRKAGLPLNAWQNGATIEAFTAEVFGDKNSPHN
jgi:AmmeMemoRadiSam system protein A